MTTANRVPMLVCGFRENQAILKRFNFTPAGRYQGSAQAIIPISEVQPADSTQTAMIRSQALKAFIGKRPDVPKPVFEAIAGTERTAEVLTQLIGRSKKWREILAS